MAEEFVFDPDEVELVSAPKKGEPGDGEGEGTGSPGDGKPSDKQGKGKGKSDLPSPDEIHERIQKKMEERGDTPGTSPGGEGEPSMGPGQAGSPGKGGALSIGAAEKRVKEAVPKMNWKSLVKKMVSSSQLATDVSYAKPSRRSVTGAAIGAALGAAAVKPGEKQTEEPVNKILFVFDTSGSMWAHVPVALSEAQSLLKQLGKINYPFGVMFFAGEHKNFVVNQGQNYYAEIPNLQELSKPISKGDQIRPWSNVLTQHGTGGTDFSSTIVSELNSSIAAGYNVVIFSDSDMTYGDNWKNFVNLWKSHKRNVFFISESQSTWRSVCQKLGQYPDNFSSIQS
jgi:hypothetical protein